MPYRQVTLRWCEFRLGVVECPEFHDCRKCGWNPTVELDRIQRIREEMKRKPKREMWRIGNGGFEK